MSRFTNLFANGSSPRLASIAVAAAMFVSVLALPGSARAQGLFQSPSPNLTTGTVPQGVAAADFNRSGWVGMVVTGSTSHNMKVFLGTGPNTFGGGTTYPTCGASGAGPSAVLATDLNHDGYPDIVVACTAAKTVQVFLNTGAGGFGTGISYVITGSPVALVAGDFVGNGHIDIAAAQSGGNVAILTNTTGNGTLATTYATASGTLSGIAAGDFNKDGYLDLAVSDSANNTVHVLTNSGSGTFTQHGTYSTGTGSKPSGIVAADFNNDGNIDVATSNSGTNTATVLLGNGTGTLTAQTPQATGTDPIAIVTTDVNSDGNPDVVAFDELSASSGAVVVLLGNGDGTLQPAQTSSQSFLPGTHPVVADFNRDGKPDLALTQQGNQLASVMLNNTLPTQYPDGRSFAAYNPLTVGNGNFADGIATGDFNKDGNLDIAVSYLQDNDVQVLLNAGGGSFSSAGTYPVGNQPYWIASGDLNGDGYPDLVTANTNVSGATGTISVLLNNKNGTFAAAASYTVGKQPYQVAIGDVNGDGYPDLAVTNYGANTVTILFGSVNGTFTVQPTTLATCANPYGVAIGDFAHNGFPSVAVTCYSAAQLEVFPNNGNGTFSSTPAIYTTDVNPSSLVVGDFNRDGKLDIVVGNTTANDIYFFAGNGNNTFAAGVESPSLNFPDSIAAGDFNGDGILDIVGVAPNFNAVELTLGVGDGTFGTFAQRAAGDITAKTQPWAVAVGDFNNDGQLDIVTANTFHQVNIASPAYQSRYLGEYPATPGGNPSIDLLTNASAVQINLTTSPASPLAYNNTGTVISANVQPAYSGGTPTGSVIFENSSGAVIGTGPYTLSGGGVASYPVGHLGSGSYLFTSLYSGDSNFQPATGSGSAFAVTVNGTPVTLTISPASVGYGGSFTATVVVTGGATGLGRPTGTLAIYSSTGFELGTVTLTNSGTNNTGGTATFTAVAPNLVPGSYNFYAIYTPTNGNYQLGSSSYAPLTVTAATTSTAIACNYALFSISCTATVTNTVTGHVVPAGLTVDFTLNGGANNPELTNAAGQATYTVGEFFGSFTVAATFPAQTYYQTSSATTNVLCFIICGLDRPSPSVPLNSFSGLGFSESFSAPASLGLATRAPLTSFNSFSGLSFAQGFYVPAQTESNSTVNEDQKGNDKNSPSTHF